MGQGEGRLSQCPRLVYAILKVNTMSIKPLSSVMGIGTENYPKRVCQKWHREQCRKVLAKIKIRSFFVIGTLTTVSIMLLYISSRK